jgi:hypothetical protein
VTGAPLPLPEETAQAFTRLATACFLSDLGIEAWCKLPGAARRSFAQAHRRMAFPSMYCSLVNQAIARFVLDDTQLQTAHRNAALGSLFGVEPNLLEGAKVTA